MISRGPALPEVNSFLSCLAMKVSTRAPTIVNRQYGTKAYAILSNLTPVLAKLQSPNAIVRRVSKTIRDST